MRLTYEMTTAEIKQELIERKDRKAGMSLGFGDRWNGEETQLDERIAHLERVLAMRLKIGDVEDKSK